MKRPSPHGEIDWTGCIRFNRDTGDIDVWNPKTGHWAPTTQDLVGAWKHIGHIVVLEYDTTWCEPYNGRRAW